MSKLVELMTCDGRKIIFNLTVFILKGFKLLPEPLGPIPM